ncbi:MAG: serine hydrolase domain-containing protein [Bacteroidales bacterium]
MKNLPYLKYPFLLITVVALSILSCGGKDNPPPAPPVDPPEEPQTGVVDELVYQFMGKNQVPGITLAVAKDGKLIYTKAYGFADSESGERMTTDTRSRISSISKTVTSIAIMTMLEEGLLTLDDKIFGPGAILEDDFGTVRPYRQYITDLTVKHCLSHHVGGWGNASNDPTMMKNELNNRDLISYIIDNVALDSKPGLSYTYSNVGFMILGRVIEKISGKSYEEYVRDKILIPIGITDMVIGGNTLADRKENESRYHNPTAYTRNFSRRDANGGWIATASDMAKLFVRIDGNSYVPDILSSATLQTMTTPPFSYNGYALGLTVSGSTWSHGGSFNGSNSQWIRTGSGFVAVILFNGDCSNYKKLLEDIIAAPITWPNHDLFTKFE